MVHKHGVWSLHFRHRLKQAGTFNLEIRGVPKDKTKILKNTIWESPLVLHFKLIVTTP